MTKAIFLTILLSVLGFVIINPTQVFMVSMQTMTAIILFVVVVFAALIFVWREENTDEREVAHSAFASRLGFFTGSIVLLVAIIVSSFSGVPDAWLIIALVAMLAGKIVGRAYLEERN